MFIDNPMIVMRFGAIQEGTLPTSHSQYPCIKGSSKDRPALWYLCSSSRLSWCLDSGGVGNWNNLFNTHPGVLICPKPKGDSGWESPHRFLVDRCPLMDLGFLLFEENTLSCFIAFGGWSFPGGRKKKIYLSATIYTNVSKLKKNQTGKKIIHIKQGSEKQGSAFSSNSYWCKAKRSHITSSLCEKY